MAHVEVQYLSWQLYPNHGICFRLVLLPGSPGVVIVKQKSGNYNDSWGVFEIVAPNLGLQVERSYRRAGVLAERCFWDLISDVLPQVCRNIHVSHGPKLLIYHLLALESGPCNIIPIQPPIRSLDPGSCGSRAILMKS